MKLLKLILIPLMALGLNSYSEPYANIGPFDEIVIPAENTTMITVDTIADLKALDQTLWTQAYVKGYWSYATAGSYRGGGHFAFNPTSTNTVDDGKVFLSDNTDDGRWERELTDIARSDVAVGWIDWYGATPAGSSEAIGQINDSAIARCMTNNGVINISIGSYRITEPIIIMRDRVIQGVGTWRGGFCKIFPTDGFVGDAIIQDYVTTPGELGDTGNWKIKNLMIYCTDVIPNGVIATSWNNNCGIFSCVVSDAKETGIWVRYSDGGTNKNWNIRGVEMWSFNNNPWTGIRVDEVLETCVLENITVLCQINSTYVHPETIMDSIDIIGETNMQMQTVGTIGTLIGTGNGQMLIKDFHAESAGIAIALAGTNSVLIQNANNNQSDEDRCSLGISELVHSVTAINVGLNRHDSEHGIWNGHSESHIDDAMNILSKARVRAYYWNRESNVELINNRGIYEGTTMSLRQAHEKTQPIYSTNLYAAYTFDDIDGDDWWDSSGNNMTGTNVNGVANTDFSYVELPVSNSHINVTSIQNDQTTIVSRFKILNWDYPTAYIFSQKTSPSGFVPSQSLRAEEDVLVYRNIENVGGIWDDVYYYTTIKSNTWMTVVSRLDGLQHSLWKDGQKLTNNDQEGLMTAGYGLSTITSFGEFERASTLVWYGTDMQYDYIYMYDESLTDDQCSALSSGANPADLIPYMDNTVSYATQPGDLIMGSYTNR